MPYTLGKLPPQEVAEMANQAKFTPDLTNTVPVKEKALARVGRMIERTLKRHMDVMQVVLEGVPATAVDELTQHGFRTSELGWIIAPRTLSHRKTKKQPLTLDESDRWFRAARVYGLAVEVFGDEDKATRWLHKSQKRFENLTPIEMIRTEVGAELVEETLGQIDSGYFA
jgi:putative toxin-antitoxin system antitoxin component (TIGR02293 family)